MTKVCYLKFTSVSHYLFFNYVGQNLEKNSITSDKSINKNDKIYYVIIEKFFLAQKTQNYRANNLSVK